MTENLLRVGIIGANPERGWGRMAHVPAAQAAVGVELTAVATTKQETADKTARQFGVPHAFGSAADLVQCPDVDVVSVCVRITHHYELVKMALEAGKHVYCEWPLVPTSGQAEELSALADQRRVHNVVGFQARVSPVVSYARALIADGYVGRPLSATVDAPIHFGKPVRDLARRYTVNREEGAGVLGVATGHTLDAVAFCLGEYAQLSAQVTVQHPVVTVIETGEQLQVTAPDQVMVAATLTSGAAVSAHMHGAKANGGRFRCSISGTDGDLEIVSVGDSGLQIEELTLWGAQGENRPLEPLHIPHSHYGPVDPEVSGRGVVGVARLYTALAEDVRSERRSLPDFAVAAQRLRLIDAISRSDDTGERQRVH